MTDKHTQPIGADPLGAAKPEPLAARSPLQPRPADACPDASPADGGGCSGGGTVKSDKRI